LKRRKRDENEWVKICLWHSRSRPRYTAASRGELIHGTEEIAQRVHKERSYRS